jgi:hypothetical protein
MQFFLSASLSHFISLFYALCKRALVYVCHVRVYCLPTYFKIRDDITRVSIRVKNYFYNKWRGKRSHGLTHIVGLSCYQIIKQKREKLLISSFPRSRDGRSYAHTRLCQKCKSHVHLFGLLCIMLSNRTRHASETHKLMA